MYFSTGAFAAFTWPDKVDPFLLNCHVPSDQYSPQRARVQAKCHRSHSKRRSKGSVVFWRSDTGEPLTFASPRHSFWGTSSPSVRNAYSTSGSLSAETILPSPVKRTRLMGCPRAGAGQAALPAKRTDPRGESSVSFSTVSEEE